jgi:hypothetical protein
MSLFWDAVSLTVVPVICTPIWLYLQTKELQYVPIITSIFITEIFISFSRQVPVLHPVMIRPAGAKNCNIYNLGGSYHGQIGMPSGHMMLTTCISFSFLFIYSRNKNTLRILYENPTEFGLTSIYVAFMAMSRVMRGCHNIPQVIAGFSLGYILAYLLY